MVTELFSSQRTMADSLVITTTDLKKWVAGGHLLRHLFRYSESELQGYRLELIPRPFLTAVLLRVLSRGRCVIKDREGQHRVITVFTFLSLFQKLVADYISRFSLLRRVAKDVEASSREEIPSSAQGRWDRSGTPVYLRTDLLFGLRSGGSVSHIAGVLNHLDAFSRKPIFLTTDVIPTVREDLETHLIHPSRSFWDFKEVPSLHFNETFRKRAQECLGERKISFFYQRYSLNNYSGVKLAKQYGVPLVLEYNGSEVWVGRNWSEPLKYESLSERIERLNLERADLVVVVSQALRDELIHKNVEATKILLNPNGADPERYSPLIDGSGVRHQNNLEGKTVIGFIGTFGQWHGAEVLAEAYGRFVKECPSGRRNVRLLVIGDGVTLPKMKKILTQHGVMETCVFTGLVPQDQGPFHLASCDILVSPHVRNPDGTPFFGSPTKVFEYMAMGKGMVASDIGQLGEILKHNETAWLAKPGDADSLKLGLKTLIDDPGLRDRLGKAARHEVITNYTWKEHTLRILQKLGELTSTADPQKPN